MWVAAIFSHCELLILYFLRVLRVMNDVATAKSITLNFMRIVVDRCMACRSRTCVFDERLASAFVIRFSSCCGIGM